MGPGFEQAAAAAHDTLVRLHDAAGGRHRLVSATVPVEPADFCAAVCAVAASTDEDWFCWEQADGPGFAIAAIGAAAVITADGPQRFREVERLGTELFASRVADEPLGLPAGAGPLLVGGFAFADDGGRSEAWNGFGSARCVVPAVSLVRTGEVAYLTLAADSGNPYAPATVKQAVTALGGGAGTGEGGGGQVVDDMADHYRQAVGDALERIAAGEVEKVVLAREVTVGNGDGAAGIALTFTGLRDRFPECFVFAAATGGSVFAGASPELLVRRRGAGVDTVALAGSAARGDGGGDERNAALLRGSAKNRHEHELVRQRIVRILEPLSVWVESGEQPSIAKVSNIQHLATPVHAQLAEPISAVDLAGRLHPTPAVAGEPVEESRRVISEIEGFDRGWYAGPVGWMDTAFDGEFCVALRSGLFGADTVRLYAGAGIVAGSSPDEELAETGLKLDALMPLVTRA